VKNADCTNCKWVNREQLTDAKGAAMVGQYQYCCRRFPPTAMLLPLTGGGFNLGCAFPVVGKGILCSLHEPADPDGALMSPDVPKALTN
jgi:hypothetical protein